MIENFLPLCQYATACYAMFHGVYYVSEKHFNPTDAQKALGKATIAGIASLALFCIEVKPNNTALPQNAQNKKAFDDTTQAVCIDVQCNKNQINTIFLDTDNNPQTIEYAGGVQNTPVNIAKWQNAGLSVGKSMNLGQWRQIVPTLERVE